MKGLQKLIVQEKLRVDEIEDENESLKREIEKLEIELDQKKRELNEDDKNRNLLNNLFEKGIIDQDGNILE